MTYAIESPGDLNDYADQLDAAEDAAEEALVGKALGAAWQAAIDEQDTVDPAGLPAPDPECAHGFSRPEWCADCRGLPKDDEPTAFRAHYHGRCGECGDEYAAGERIVGYGERGEYAHAGCVL